MIPEDARNEGIDFCDIEGVKDGEDVASIEFRCAHPSASSPGVCDRPLGEARIGQFGPGWVHEVCLKRCLCGNYSGFMFSTRSTDAPSKLKMLADELTDLKKMTAEKKWIIQSLLAGRNLKLRLGVKRQK